MAETLITYAYIRDKVLQQCKSAISNYQTWNASGFVNGTQSYNNTIKVGSYNNNGTNTNINLRFTGTVSNSVNAVADITINNDINNFITNNLGMNASQVNSVVNNK